MKNENDTFDPMDDPRLTAFALGELEGDERAEIAARCAASPELAAEVAAIRGLARALEARLGAAAAGAHERNGDPRGATELRPEQRARLLMEAQALAAPRRRRGRRLALRGLVAVAATAAFVVGAQRALERFGGDDVGTSDDRLAALGYGGGDEDGLGTAPGSRQKPEHTGSNAAVTLGDGSAASAPSPDVNALESLRGLGYVAETDSSYPDDPNVTIEGALVKPPQDGSVTLSRPDVAYRLSQDSSLPAPGNTVAPGQGTPPSIDYETLGALGYGGGGAAPAAPGTGPAGPGSPARVSGTTAAGESTLEARLDTGDVVSLRAMTAPGAGAAGDDRAKELEQLRGLGYVGTDRYRHRYDRPFPVPNTESYAPIRENPFRSVADEPLSTFSIDVDTASYANVRRFLTSGQLPPADAVRIEEMVNYFTYDDPAPTDGTPFATRLEVAPCPWTPEHRLVRIGIKGRAPAEMENPGRNLVFLVDVSGSMAPANKLPLVVQSLQLLTRHLDGQDRIAIVTYAGSSGLLLPSTSCDQKATIAGALASLGAGGSTNGAGGIELAYRIAAESFLSGGVNRVILATDGDFNVGITDQGSLLRLIEEKAKSDIFLSVLGFGTGNTKDATMELLADHGNGNYAYIDTLLEAKKVLVDELRGTLDTIAKDVKIQVEFNPAAVSAFRLIGYENRILAHQDFNDDTRDAGEIGAGHSITALYELVPRGASLARGSIDALKYQPVPAAPVTEAPLDAQGDARPGELLTVKLRYKEPTGTTSKKLEFPLRASDAGLAESSADLRFAAAVAGFGMWLRNSPERNAFGLDQVYELAFGAAGIDATGYRAEFLRLVQRAQSLGGGR